MRKNLPLRAQEFLAMLREDRPRLISEIGQAISGNFDVPPRLIAEWLAKDSGHIHFFRAVAEAYGLKGQEVHDAYLSLLPSERAEIDVATKAEMLEEALRRQG